MGLLTLGESLSWSETATLADHVRKHGVLQFINQYHKLKDMKKDILYWGDEIEYMMIKFDHENRAAKVVLKAVPVLEALIHREEMNPHDRKAIWAPEYAAYMVEGTPAVPYGGFMAHFNVVEANMKIRRELIAKCLGPNEVPISLTVFPRLGCPNFTDPTHQPTPTSGSSRSLFFPDDVIFPGHPRYKNLTRNIRERRGEKVAINIPIYKDTNTLDPFVEDLSQYGDDGTSQKAALPDHIYMDAMGFGMGNSCLQVTFQACNIDEARFLYDQLTPLCPILLALSAASPIYRGHLSDVDCRWCTIAQSVDDRTEEERGLKPLKKNRFCINKSRYDSIDSYLSPQGARYNDIDIVYDHEIYDQLRSEGIDPLLSTHVAHLFIRDPVSLFREKIDQDDTQDTDHFENIQSTNWQTMRFKPPPPGSNIGWRVEFRPMEIQLTDFENAAYVVFIVLLTRVILTFKLNFLIPISKVDENLANAQKRDAVLNQKFYFRKDPVTVSSPAAAAECCPDRSFECVCISDEYTLLTAQEIISGKGSEFPGLIPFMRKYLNLIECDVDTQCTVRNYLDLIAARASGEMSTTAHCIRNFVLTHPDYKHDSVVSDAINYDLLMKCSPDPNVKTSCNRLLAQFTSKTRDDIPAALSQTKRLLNEQRQKIQLRNGASTDTAPVATDAAPVASDAAPVATDAATNVANGAA